MKAMILAAGYGERLWPLTADRTKPALPVLGKPLVGYVAEYLAAHGVTDVIANLHHWPDSVRQSLGDGSRFGVHLDYVHEPVILGTSGALDNAKEFFDSGTFVLINGKIITDIDLNAALETHRRTEALATLVLKTNVARERFSVVETRDGLVTRFGGMPGPSRKDDPLMFTGIQILEPRIFEYIPPAIFSHTTTDVYPQAIAQGERIAAHVGDGMWHELSTLQRYLGISLALLQTQGRNIYAGAATTIAEGAVVADSILWDGVVVERGASVNKAVLGDGVQVREGEIWENVIVVRNEIVAGKTAPAKAIKGQTIGDKFVVPLSQ
jgi:NDP-sugar pyrophosphorylase family protein